MSNTTLFKDISDSLAAQVNEYAKELSHDKIRAYEAIVKLMMDKRLYRDTTDSKSGSTHDIEGNRWKIHSFYNGWLGKNKNKTNTLIADGVFSETLIITIKNFDATKGAAFVTYFCDVLHKRMQGHMKDLSDAGYNIGPSLDDIIEASENDSPISSMYEDISAQEALDDIEPEPHIYIKFGRGLIKSLDGFVRSKSSAFPPAVHDYFKTFYTLETCAIVRLSSKPNRIIYYEHEIIGAVDYEIMYGLYIEKCETFKEVLFAHDKYPGYINSEKKGVERPGMYHDVIITFIKKTRNGTFITKEQVSKYKKSYNAIIDEIEF